MGSGIDWVSHIKEHGLDIKTEILKECNSKKELTKWGKYYSNLWKIVESKEWANRIPESGGGGTPNAKTRKKLSEALKGKKKPPRTAEHTEKIAKARRGVPNYKNSVYAKGKKVSKKIRQKQANSLKKWYESNPDKSHDKAKKTWQTRYKNNLPKYIKVLSLIELGYNNRTIQKYVKMDNSVITKLRTRKHSIFFVFPVLKQFKTS